MVICGERVRPHRAGLNRLTLSIHPYDDSTGVGALEKNQSMMVRCWGTRGSIPTPGPSTIRFGGNTSCVEVAAGNDRLILDAGTGIRLLGQQVLSASPAKEATILLTHFHWDHIQGFPFFINT